MNTQFPNSRLHRCTTCGTSVTGGVTFDEHAAMLWHTQFRIDSLRPHICSFPNMVEQDLDRLFA